MMVGVVVYGRQRLVKGGVGGVGVGVGGAYWGEDGKGVGGGYGSTVGDEGEGLAGGLGEDSRLLEPARDNRGGYV